MDMVGVRGGFTTPQNGLGVAAQMNEIENRGTKGKSGLSEAAKAQKVWLT